MKKILALFLLAVLSTAQAQLIQTTVVRTAINKPIPDLGVVYDTIFLNLNNTCVGDINVRVDTVTHTFVSDLIFRVTHDGVSRVIINQVGGGGDNFIFTTINDSAACIIGTSGCNVAPFTGSFKPFQSLMNFNNQGVMGPWILSVRDTAADDSGTLRSWAIVFSHFECMVGIEPNSVPVKYSLSQNYPNPFNPATTIEYSLLKPSNVKLVVYDANGKEVIKLVNEYKPSGYYRLIWDASALPSGVYFYEITTDEFKDSKKMVLIK
ncbi:MAG: T9SS type A sorting domain-containing protein [Chlorobi bacterium]|nr:T9SS type A sorting domain-containing protein [Chlorobiota bacterium]